MIKGKMVYIILAVIIFTALILRIFSEEDNWVCVDGYWVRHGNPTTAEPRVACPGVKNEDNQKFILEGEPLATTTISATTTSPVAPNPETEIQVTVLDPLPDATVSSPLVIKGQARGNWFFEASLPVRLLDDKKQLIASIPAQAEGDWMTDNLVPFSALLEFNTTATSGYLVIAKDNPSGLAEHDASYTVPINFLNK
ncbi:MAG: Gmad2 immunoglobulin-like domain-containing protein [Candidatus Falkowbacteria bacterium]